MNLKSISLLVFLVSVLLLSGCKASQEITYLQGAGKAAVMDSTSMAPIPDAVIKKGDLLTITVNSLTPELAKPFNLSLVPTTEMGEYSQTNATAMTSGSGGLQNYLVDNKGFINFPLIGKISVEGITKVALSEKIKSLIYPRYITEEPIITIRYVDFGISVLGEVARPGTFKINNESCTILEAIALAGDLTISGKRDNVLLIRQAGNLRESIRLDLRDKNLINSPYYFLQQDDVLYVQPNDVKARSSKIGTAESLSLSAVSTLISITTLIISIVK